MMQLNLINNEDKEIENIFILTYSIVSDFNIYFYFILCQKKNKTFFWAKFFEKQELIHTFIIVFFRVVFQELYLN